MANSLNENIFGAISTIVDSKIDQLEYDVTEVCKLTSNYRQKEQNYTADLKGSEILVYPKDDTVYEKDDVVLITIPKNNLTEKKYIAGLAYQITPIYETPSAKFVPLQTIYFCPEGLVVNMTPGDLKVNRKQIKNTTQFSNYIKRCDTIYVSLQLKFLQGIEEYQTSSEKRGFGLRLELIYDYKETPVNIYLDSAQFIGNPTYPYLMKQDVCIPNYQVDKDLLQYNLYVYNNIPGVSFEIPKDGVCIQFGYKIETQTGIELVQLDQDNLEYNNTSTVAFGSTDRVGLVWYNTDENGKFIGFNLSNFKGKKPEDCFYDEKQYQDYALKVEQCKTQYEKETYPYDFQGLELAAALEETSSRNEEIENTITSFSNALSDFQQDMKELWYELALDPIFMSEEDEEGIEAILNAWVLDGTITEEQKTSAETIAEAKIRYQEDLLNEIWNFESDKSDEYREALIVEFNRVITEIDAMKISNPRLTIDYARQKEKVEKMLQDVRTYQEMPKSELVDKASELEAYKNQIQGLDSYYSTLETLLSEQAGSTNEILSNLLITNDSYARFLGSLQDYFFEYYKFNKSAIVHSPAYTESRKQQEIEKLYADYNKMIEDFNYGFEEIYLNAKDKLELYISSLSQKVAASKEANAQSLQAELQNYFVSWLAEFTSNETEELIEKEVVYSSEKVQENLEKDKEKLSFYFYIKDSSITEIDSILREAGWRLLDINPMKVLGFNYNLDNDGNISSIDPININSFLSLNRDYLSEFTTYRAVLYYDRQKVGDTTIQYKNKQYVIPSDDNPYIDINYFADRYIITQPLKLTIKALNDDGEYINNLSWNSKDLLKTPVNVEVLQKDLVPYTINWDSEETGKMLTFGVQFQTAYGKKPKYCILKISVNNDQVAYLPLPTAVGKGAEWISIDGASMLTLTENGNFSWNKTGDDLVLAKPFSYAGGIFTPEMGQIEYSMHLYENNTTEEYVLQESTILPIALENDANGNVRLTYNDNSTLDIMDYYYIVEIKLPADFGNEIIYYPVLVTKILEEEE